MTREEAKKLLPIIQAYAEGKTIQFRVCNNKWVDIDDPSFEVRIDYRIKPELKYRPFKNQEECYNEMFKHEPFGCVKDKDGQYIHIRISSVGDKKDLDNLFKTITFIDGTPFGVQEE